MKQAPLWGLVLAGGHSKRMGVDKALLRVHRQTQLTWTAALLAPFCQRVLASVRAEQIETLGEFDWPLIPDQLDDSGPLAGILAALQRQPGVAWLVVACDMPWLDAETMGQLVTHRDPAKRVTAFIGSKGPEPLCTIWEPGVLASLNAALSKGQRSPRRILTQLPIKQLVPTRAKALLSINTPELLQQARQDFA